MTIELDALRDQILQDIAAAADTAALEAVKIEALGKKGRLSLLMRDMGALDHEARRARGQALNAIKDIIQAALDQRQEALARAERAAQLQAETLDLSLPPRPADAGALHPIGQTMEEFIAIFAAMGFTVGEGPEIESDWYNFTALNMPEDHPARAMQDTFYLPAHEGRPQVLRTHTSPVQIRSMMGGRPPIRVIAPGRTYRSDYDQTHTPMFHQLEGIVIDRTTHMGHLKGTLALAMRQFFAVEDLPLRFRPSYFPFTEPSAEVDIGCRRAGGELVIGNHGDWLEIGGCGMVNPAVIANCGLDPAEYQGFAFGMGIERMAMLKYGIPDLRTFFDGDIRWLRHYGFAGLLQPALATGLTGLPA